MVYNKSKVRAVKNEFCLVFELFIPDNWQYYAFKLRTDIRIIGPKTTQ